MTKKRLDTVLVERGVFDAPEQVVPYVAAREVKVGDAYAQSPAMMVDAQAEIQVKGRDRFVSRGGYKLQAALDAFGLRVEGLCCIDVGSSTGGFSDCLLQAGAARVACVDVNYGELAWKVRNDPRTTVYERTNIRTADPAQLGAPFDVVVADLSFIGLAQLAQQFAALCTQGSILVALVKPQFESAPGEAEGGLVADQAVRVRTVEEVQAALESAGFAVVGAIESPVPGKKAGNIEYLLHAVFEGGSAAG